MTVVAGRVPGETRATTCGAPPETPCGATAATGADIPITTPIPPRCCALATTGRISAKLATIQIRRIKHLPGDATGARIPPLQYVHPTLKRCACGHLGFTRDRRESSPFARSSCLDPVPGLPQRVTRF